MLKEAGEAGEAGEADPGACCCFSVSNVTFAETFLFPHDLNLAGIFHALLVFLIINKTKVKKKKDKYI